MISVAILLILKNVSSTAQNLQSYNIFEHSEGIHVEDVYDVSNPVVGVEYTVVYGDTVDSLATRFHSSAADIEKINEIDTEDLMPGKALVIPESETSSF